MPDFLSQLSFPSTLGNLTLVESAVDELLAKGLISESLYGNVIVAATEGALNAIQHGNKNDPQLTTHVSISIHDNVLCITVDDEGNGFDFKNLPDPTDPENLDKVNGRGIFIIHNLADNVEFERNGATMKMTFNLDVHEAVLA